jgi:hypothetical protein
MYEKRKTGALDLERYVVPAFRRARLTSPGTQASAGMPQRG